MIECAALNRLLEDDDLNHGTMPSIYRQLRETDITVGTALYCLAISLAISRAISLALSHDS